MRGSVSHKEQSALAAAADEAMQAAAPVEYPANNPGQGLVGPGVTGVTTGESAPCRW